MQKLIQFPLLICLSLSISTALGMDSERKRLGQELISAAGDGDTKRCKKLLEKKADINCIAECGISTPLSNACYWGHPECVKMLIAHGAKLDQKDGYHNTGLTLASGKAKYCNTADRLVIDKRREQACQILIEAMIEKQQNIKQQKQAIRAFLGIRKRSQIIQKYLARDIVLFIARIWFGMVQKDKIDTLAEINRIQEPYIRQPWLNKYASQLNGL